MTPLAIACLWAAAAAAVPATDGLDYLSVPAQGGARPFLLGRTEVTRAAFRRFVEATRWKTTAELDGWSWVVQGDDLVKKEGIAWASPGFDQGEDHPVVHVSWYDAEGYCAWAGGRLPAEGEWERAARAGDGRRLYVWGGEPMPKVGGRPQANVADETLRRVVAGLAIFAAYDDGYVFTSAAGTFPANGLGFVDLAGNVSEWCAEWYDEKRVQRVLRGGSWMNGPEGLGLAYRNFDRPASHLPFVGFRCARHRP